MYSARPMASAITRDTSQNSKKLLMRTSPLFPDWNFHILKGLFLLFPHSATHDAIADFFVLNALASSWIYAAVFYLYWRIEDDRTIWRRSRLFETFVTFCLATFTSLALRPWFGWPAPTLVPRFQQLYPRSLWETGNPNCFPSHSTLIYFLIAVGFWRFKRWVSVLLIAGVFLLISIPRLYVGGHYPIDIIAAVLCAAAAQWAAHLICVQRGTTRPLTCTASKGLAVEAFLFLWLFELGNGFRSSYWILGNLLQAARKIWH